MRTKQPITSINGFSIGDKVRLLDGDGREHTIKSFSIEGLNEFFFEVQFEDGSWAMLDNIELLSSNLDDMAEEYAYNNWEDNDYHTGASEGLPFDAIGHTEKCFKAGAEWMMSQGVSYDTTISADKTIPVLPMKDVSDMGLDYGDRVIVQIRKK